jgi:hypothetical protein
VTKTSCCLPRGFRMLTLMTLLTFSAIASCKSPPSSSGGGGGQGGSGGAGGTGGNFSCGGVTNVSGTTPKGTLSTDSVRVVLAAASCNSPGTPTFVIKNSQTDDELTFTLALQSDAGASAILGQQSISALVSVSGTTMSVTGSVNVSAADDPRAVSLENADGGILHGTIAGTLAISDGGVSITGSFQSPYCTIAKCFGH